MPDKKTRVVVLISGGGSNLQAIIDATEAGQLPITLCAVISNKPAVGGLQRAEKHNIPALVLEHTQFENRESFDRALIKLIDEYQPDLLVLAGFMRVLTAEFTRHYRGRMLNIHPSLLPKYQGLHTHQRALDAGDKVHGVTVHFVTEELDGGPKVIQAEVPILPSDTAESLAAKVLTQEHRIYPQAIGWFATDRLQMQDGVALLDGQPLK
jgi:phosphoribosylglycinamide formyltransferase-1